MDNELVKINLCDLFKNDIPDKNGRIWDENLVKKVIDKYNESQLKVVQFNNPNIICNIKEVNFDNKFQETIKETSLVGFSLQPRGLCKKNNDSGHYEIKKIISFDLVNNNKEG